MEKMKMTVKIPWAFTRISIYGIWIIEIITDSCTEDIILHMLHMLVYFLYAEDNNSIDFTDFPQNERTVETNVSKI